MSRNRFIRVYLSQEEYDRAVQAANQSALTLSSWARSILLQTIEPPRLCEKARSVGVTTLPHGKPLPKITTPGKGKK